MSGAGHPAFKGLFGSVGTAGYVFCDCSPLVILAGYARADIAVITAEMAQEVVAGHIV